MEKNRIPLLVGNWKMHGSFAMIENLLSILLPSFSSVNSLPLKNNTNHINESSLEQITGVECVICPPSVYLQTINERIRGSSIQLGAQNAYSEKEGAFTGEISSQMLYELGCRYVILGHSERRHLFSESNELIARKCVVSYHAGLSPILCLGETLEERQTGRTFEVILQQLNALLEKASIDLMNRLVLAYEPVWAIGTGQTATPSQALEVHAFLRESIAKRFPEQAEKIRILYGGSVKAENAESLFGCSDIDGGLIGGASLKAPEFLNIYQTMSKLWNKLS